MVTTFRQFVDSIKSKSHFLLAIPREYLNEEGKEMQDLYKKLSFDVDFAGSASDMIDLLADSKYDDFRSADATRELRMIAKCLKKMGDI